MMHPLPRRPFITLFLLLLSTVAIEGFTAVGVHYSAAVALPRRRSHDNEPSPIYTSSSPVLLNLFRSRKDDRETAAKGHIRRIESHIDWMELLVGDEIDDPTTTRLVVVTFTASWCRYCKKFFRRWNHKFVHGYYNNKFKHGKHGRSKRRKRGRQEKQYEQNESKEEIEYEEKTLEVIPIFASVECDGATSQLCQSLNIEQLPSLQFYWDGNLINSFPCGPRRRISMAGDTLRRYLQMTSIHELQQEQKQWSLLEQAERSTAPTAAFAGRGSRSRRTYRTARTGALPTWRPIESLYLRY